MTRKTKKTGNNLHCIMAFKRLEETPTPSGFFINVSHGAPVEDQNATEVSESEIEELDSSDSEYVAEVSRRRDGGQQLESSSSATELSEVERRVLEAWKASRIQMNLTKDGSHDPIHIPVEDLIVEDVDSSEPRGDTKRRKPFQSPTNQAPSSSVTEMDRKPSEKQSSSPSLSRLTVPEIRVPPDGDAPEDYTQVGTFKKKKSTLPPEVVPSASVTDKGQSASKSTEGQELHVAPSSLLTRPRSETYVKSDQSASPEGSPHCVDDTDVGLRRSGTFTKGDSPRIKRMRPSTSESSTGDGEDYGDGGFGANRMRSKTFTKHSPPPSSLAAPPTEEGNVGVADEGSSSGLKRSGTFTKEKPRNIVVTRADSEGGTSEEEEALAATGSGLKRSGTFTKEKPSSEDQDGKDGPHEYILSWDNEDIDLDETLKAVEMTEDSKGGYSSGSEESLDEVLVLPQSVNVNVSEGPPVWDDDEYF